jgi:hypothetical protein
MRLLLWDLQDNESICVQCAFRFKALQPECTRVVFSQLQEIGHEQ